MGLFGNFDKPGPGIPKGLAPKKGPALFFDMLMREFFELVKLNLLFLLFCIPVVTIPAAMTAMSRVTLKMVRDENHFLWHDFTRCFKQEWKPATLLGIPLILLQLLGVFSLFFYREAAALQPVFYLLVFVSIAALFLLFCVCMYLFTQLAIIDLPVRQLVRNAVLLSVIGLIRNVGVLILLAGFLLLKLFLFPISLLYQLLIGFAITGLILSQCAYGLIDRYVLADREMISDEEGSEL